MAMASDKRKREETEWQNFGSQGRWAVENTDISGMEDANRTGGENMGRRMQVEGQEQSLGKCFGYYISLRLMIQWR